MLPGLNISIGSVVTLTRHPKINRIASLNIGVAYIAYQSRKREVRVMGENDEFQKFVNGK